MAKTYENQGVLFPTDDFRDRSFEYKRAEKRQKRENRIGKTDLIIKLPYIYCDKQFIVSRTTGGVFHCQADPRNPLCRHIRAIKKLLQLRQEAGYKDITDKQFLKNILPIGEVK